MDEKQKTRVANYLHETKQDRALIYYGGRYYLCVLYKFKPSHAQDTDSSPPALSSADLLPPPVELK